MAEELQYVKFDIPKRRMSNVFYYYLSLSLVSLFLFVPKLNPLIAFILALIFWVFCLCVKSVWWVFVLGGN
jgi:hypothetical protein